MNDKMNKIKDKNILIFTYMHVYQKSMCLCSMDHIFFIHPSMDTQNESMT